MGEAKRRGSRDQRVAGASALIPTPESVRDNMGFPETCKFIGYVVHLPDSDEFLARATEPQPGVLLYQYAATPGLAKVYPQHHTASKVANGIQKHRTVVAFLFDHGTQWLVGFTDPETEPQS
ncbi:hypothetical protein [Cupriavidus basilensis]|uniref:hypothetical protein n=1 Tax=Cupriavidus basilensis TaxID=68895 RepID=UPI0020A63576|nr:hypothetical protein [Cupriavidus basilensis]MCP3025165.1 hypothetical protein [Cupriavidus basilensis]